MPSISSIFSADGLLADAIEGFLPRQAQTDMAEAVQQALNNQHSLIVEAGTGTGKTFAYLAPALVSKGKAIISTGTKNLQEQLYHRDLPVIKKALASNRKTALLKGRANYLCLHRLGQHGGNSTLVEKEVLGQLSTVRAWANTTKTGDVGELKTLPEDAKVLPLVTSTVDNCLGRECPDYEDCYLVKARRKALDADIIVVNHHLFFADMALKDTGFGELIPEADAIIFDEAHQIPEIASDYFGESLSSRQIQDLAKDINLLYRTVLKDADQLDKAADKCRLLAADLRLLFADTPARGNWQEALQREEVRSQTDRLADALGVLHEVARLHIGRDKDLDNLYERVVQARERLDALRDDQQQGVSLWYETTPRHIVLHLTPLSIAAKFRRFVSEPPRGWVFTSATLMVDGGFEHFQRRMGLEDAKTLGLDSPFDYQQQAMLCVPRYLPEPNSFEMREWLYTVSRRLIAASRGRCFLLFTSHAMLRDIAARLSQSVDNPLLVQGTTTKQALLSEYLAREDAVLLGTGAFWEGVDVRGSDLVCVMIDKLPFASPDDPLLQARIEDVRKKGANPFSAIQIPQAVITLKQGAGRLIRDSADKGVLVICDNRLVTKPYASTFLGSLPDMRRTRSLEEVESFLATID
ncbi:ATP-dependent DNA helicase [Alteromonas aestuariivivens]|uniref:DNA 5'-3' helicase n=1 Tax=Alteromonas aestuariivivens TaxID=1938339 RepID=A0A3D8M4N5_9ALTE|nr:ATP-dependent DNA helicase [Alteromonas aestuariivivens]RDV24707.1 ATP-dependent DNA helicase [Alteromonas aestuariivivens]